jgi:hypothetical protein
MSKEDYDLKKLVIEAIPNEQVLEPSIPVSAILQEAEDTYEWIQPDLAKLTEADLDPEIVKDLPVRTGALRYIQSVWNKEYKSQESAQKTWNEVSPSAYNLRDTLIHDFLFGYRKNADLLSKTQRIAEGTGHADMLQDLSDLAVLGKANPEPLIKINLDFTQLDLAETTSEELTTVLAQANGARKSDNSTKILRDKAYTHLKEAMDEIRKAGQYVFWRTPDRHKGYISDYRKHKTGSKKNKPDTSNP